MRKLLEMCVYGLGLLVTPIVAFGLFLVVGLLGILLWAGESVASPRDGEPPEGL